MEGERERGRRRRRRKLHIGLVFYTFQLPSPRLSSFDSYSIYSCQACYIWLSRLKMATPEAVQQNGLDEDVNVGLDGHSSCCRQRY